MADLDLTAAVDAGVAAAVSAAFAAGPVTEERAAQIGRDVGYGVAAAAPHIERAAPQRIASEIRRAASFPLGPGGDPREWADSIAEFVLSVQPEPSAPEFAKPCHRSDVHEPHAYGSDDTGRLQCPGLTQSAEQVIVASDDPDMPVVPW